MIASGRYLFRVEVPGKGFAEECWIARVRLSAWGIKETELSQGGQVITVSGRGFDLNNAYPTYGELQNAGDQDKKIANLDCFHFYDYRTY